MWARIREFLAIPGYTDPETGRAVGFLNWFHLTVAVCSSIVAIVAFTAGRQALWFLLGTSVVALVTTAWSYLVMRRGYVQVSGAVLCVVVLLLLTGAGVLSAYLRPVMISGYVIVILIGGLLVGWRAALLCGALSLLSVLAVQASASGAERTALGAYSVWSAAAATVGAIAGTTALVVYLVREWSLSAFVARWDGDVRDRQPDPARLDASSTRRLELLHAVVELTAQIAPLSEQDEIVHRSVEAVSGLPGVAWAGLFRCEVLPVGDARVDTEGDKQVVLVASAGNVDASIALPGERIALSTSPALSLCVRRGEGQVADLVRLGLSSQAGQLGPDLGSVLLLPLRVEEDVRGVLALHEGSSARGTIEMDVAQAAADHIAVFLHRAELNANLRASVADAKRAVQRHVESLWDAVTESGSHVTGLRYASRQVRADSTAWLPSMAKAVREATLVTTEVASDAVLAAPLVQSDVVIGAVGLRRPASRPWTEDERGLVQSVIDQVTQALENRRLFELARDRAQRERMLRRITERVRGQADLDGALAAAVEQMREITGATRVAIRLARPEGPVDGEIATGAQATPELGD
jgi:GAF domain-containing protein